MIASKNYINRLESKISSGNKADVIFEMNKNLKQEIDRLTDSNHHLEIRNNDLDEKNIKLNQEIFV